MVKVPKLGGEIENARGDAVKKVFDPDIYDAVNRNSIRQQELMQGLHKTKCVSFHFLGNGADINLRLNPLLATKIGRRLFG